MKTGWKKVWRIWLTMIFAAFMIGALYYLDIFGSIRTGSYTSLIFLSFGGAAICTFFGFARSTPETRIFGIAFLLPALAGAAFSLFASVYIAYVTDSVLATLKTFLYPVVFVSGGLFFGAFAGGIFAMVTNKINIICEPNIPIK